MLYFIFRSLAVVLFKILFRLQAFGRDNIPLKGGFILAGNHQSYLDPPVVGAACPRVLYFLATEELFKNRLFGAFIAGLNTVAINRQSGDLASLRWTIKKLEAGKAVAIFPEGRRTPDGELDEPMRGVGLLAARTGVPIVPAFIEGSNRALPVNSRLVRPKKVRIYFGRPIFAQEIAPQPEKGDYYRAIAARTMQEITRLKNESNESQAK